MVRDEEGLGAKAVPLQVGVVSVVVAAVVLGATAVRTVALVTQDPSSNDSSTPTVAVILLITMGLLGLIELCAGVVAIAATKGLRSPARNQGTNDFLRFLAITVAFAGAVLLGVIGQALISLLVILILIPIIVTTGAVRSSAKPRKGRVSHSA